MTPVSRNTFAVVSGRRPSASASSRLAGEEVGELLDAVQDAAVIGFSSVYMRAASVVGDEVGHAAG